MELNIDNIIIAYNKTLSIIDNLMTAILKRREKKEKQLEILQAIIYNQRCLKYVCRGEYDSKFFIDYENRITDFLRTFFDNELADTFEIENKNIYWSLRLGSSIDDFLIESSLEKFIELCNKKKFKVQ